MYVCMCVCTHVRTPVRMYACTRFSTFTSSALARLLLQRLRFPPQTPKKREQRPLPSPSEAYSQARHFVPRTDKQQRERARGFTHIYIYIYIRSRYKNAHTYIHTYIHIYIYIHIHIRIELFRYYMSSNPPKLTY